MTHIEPCRESDVAEVANLHRKVFHGVDAPASDMLQAYYRKVFFENPWRRDDLPSLVCRGRDGSLLGFLGVVPRPMSLNNRPIWAAVAHRLMVAPQREAAFTAAKLVKGFLAGKQDLSLSDGATDDGRRIMEAAGAMTVLPYSMNWIRPIRPFAYALTLLERKGRLPLWGRLISPLCGLADSATRRMVDTPYRVNGSVYVRDSIDEEALMEVISRVSRGKSIAPVYEKPTLGWILGNLRSNRHRGEFRGFLIQSPAGRPMGSCLYYRKANGVCEVVHMACEAAAAGDLLKCLVNRVWREGACCVFGRLEPEFTATLWDHHCVMKRGAWTVAHSRDPLIIDRILRGDIFLTGLEGELWMNSPKDFDE